MLAAKFNTQLLTAQLRPQQPLAISHLAALGLGKFSGIDSGLVLHVAKPPIPASPSGARRKARVN